MMVGCGLPFSPCFPCICHETLGKDGKSIPIAPHILSGGCHSVMLSITLTLRDWFYTHGGCHFDFGPKNQNSRMIPEHPDYSHYISEIPTFVSQLLLGH